MVQNVRFGENLNDRKCSKCKKTKEPQDFELRNLVYRTCNQCRFKAYQRMHPLNNIADFNRGSFGWRGGGRGYKTPHQVDRTHWSLTHPSHTLSILLIFQHLFVLTKFILAVKNSDLFEFKFCMTHYPIKKNSILGELKPLPIRILIGGAHFVR